MLGICYLCLAQHYSEGFYFFFFFFKSLNWTCQHWGATQLCKEHLGWQWHSCRGLGWALLVQQGCTQRPLCHRTHQEGSRYPDSWQTVASPAFHVAPSLVTTASLLVTLERAQRNSSSTVLFFPKATIFWKWDHASVTPLNLFGSR